jgi:Uma2 family endonuclease
MQRTCFCTFARDAYFYPDVAVTCSESDESSAREDATVFREPRVIFEVLSDSTEAFDRGLEFEAYRQIPTLREYVLVSSRAQHVEAHRREPDGSWSASKVGDGTLRIESSGIAIPLGDLYDDVQFDTA